MDSLGTDWFLDSSFNVDVIPTGYQKLLYIGNLPGPSPQEIQDIAQKAPGSVWYIVGEPNRRPGYSASEIVVQLHDLYGEIKQADPTAVITSPSMLNWDFTCNGCAGYQSGHAWVEEFRSEYWTRYAEEPPVDIWALDAYPIDWFHLPTVNYQLVIDQVIGLRQYLDQIPGQQGKPIWITELGLHWGWDDWTFDVEGCTTPTPAGTYQTDVVIGYLDELFDWLDANALSMGIEQWFLYRTYSDIEVCKGDAYAGLTLFDGPTPGANLTEVGQFLKRRILGQE